jgi:hypothetical protein
MNEKQFWASAKSRSIGCWLWSRTTVKGGYGRVRYGKKSVVAHRVAWELTNGPVPDGMLVCHACDNPACINPAHLFLGTHKTNAEDRDRKGRQARGLQHSRMVAAGQKRSEAERAARARIRMAV